jgi:DNA-binding HxlR family transcriptional regulator
MIMALKEVVCEMEVTLSIIGGKWKPLILYYLGENGTKRFGEIKSFLCRISHKTLTNQLKELEKDGMLNRTVYPDIPPKVEYSLTEKGKSLIPILEAICEWGDKNMNENYKLIKPLCE